MNMQHDNHIYLKKHLAAAEGYLVLEMEEDAWKELEDIAVDDLPSRSEKSQYLGLVLELAMRSKDWDLGAQIAEALGVVAPDNFNAYVHGAFCLHELGKTEQALALLRNAPPALRAVPLYHYNLGCYHAVLGDQGNALRCLKEAFQRDPALKSTATHDPDLKGLGKFL
jgi:tetratricopeptide (TPR) repeat protein